MSKEEIGTKMIIKILKTMWICIALFVLFVTLYGFDSKPNSDIGVILAWSMLFLSFPAGLIVPLIYVALYEFFYIWFSTTYLSLMLDWTGFFVAGYLQWFKLVPYLLKKWQTRTIKKVGHNN